MNEYKYKQGFCALIRRTKRIKYTEFRAHIIANVRERTCAATMRIYFYFVRSYCFSLSLWIEFSKIQKNIN